MVFTDWDQTKSDNTLTKVKAVWMKRSGSRWNRIILIWKAFCHEYLELKLMWHAGLDDSGAGTEHQVICWSTHCSQLEKKLEISVKIHVVCLILFGLIVSIWAPPFCYTIIRQMFYEETLHTPSHLSPDPYVACEGVKCTTHKQPSWPMGTMCVSVCVPWGPLCVCWVRGGQGFNKGTGLVQGCQSDCLGTCNVMGSRWEPPDWTSSSKPTVCWCTSYVPLHFEPHFWFTEGFEGWATRLK